MEWIEVFTASLRKNFEAAQKKNDSFSIRKFAAEIGVPPSTLSELMRGRAVVTPLKATLILDKLDLEAREKNYILAAMKMPINLQQATLAASDYDILTDWTYLAVLHFYELDAADKSVEAIAKRLLLDEAKVDSIIVDLLNRGLLVRNEAGTIVHSGTQWQSSDGPSKEVIRLHHHNNLDCAQRAIDVIPVEERDFTTSTFAGDEAQIQKVREEIREMHRRVSAIVEGAGPRNRILRLTVGFFPLDTKAEGPEL